MRFQQVALTFALILASCERQPPVPASHAELPAGDSTVLLGEASRRMWDASLGPMIGTVSLENGSPVVYLSDSTRTGTLIAELFSRDTTVGRAVFELNGRDGACAWRRAAHLTIAADAKPGPWSLALSPGVGRPIAVEAIAELTSHDSSGFAIGMSRLASAVPDDSISAPFRGLPVVIRDAWRFQLIDGTSVAIAVAMRSTNVESSPRAEMATVVAEPDPSSSTGGWRAAWSRRVAGPEDHVEGTDLLAALQLRGGRAVIVFVRDGDRGPQLEFVERVANGSWRTRWTTEQLPCAPPVL